MQYLYFDNLDVQNEINNKLDAMAESGELSALITPLVPAAVGAWLTEHLTPTEPPVDNTLSIEGAAADAKTVGDLFHISLKFPVTYYNISNYIITINQG